MYMPLFEKYLIFVSKTMHFNLYTRGNKDLNNLIDLGKQMNTLPTL